MDASSLKAGDEVELEGRWGGGRLFATVVTPKYQKDYSSWRHKILLKASDANDKYVEHLLKYNPSPEGEPLTVLIHSQNILHRVDKAGNPVLDGKGQDKQFTKVQKELIRESQKTAAETLINDLSLLHIQALRREVTIEYGRRKKPCFVILDEDLPRFFELFGTAISEASHEAAMKLLTPTAEGQPDVG